MFLYSKTPRPSLAEIKENTAGFTFNRPLTSSSNKVNNAISETVSYFFQLHRPKKSWMGSLFFTSNGNLEPEQFIFFPFHFLLFNVSLKSLQLMFTPRASMKHLQSWAAAEMTAATSDLSPRLFLAGGDAKQSVTGWFDKEVLVKWQLYQVEANDWCPAAGGRRLGCV